MNNKIVHITTLGSEYHVEITPSDVGKNDLHVIQELIKKLAQKTPCEEIPCRGTFSFHKMNRFILY